MDFLYTIGMMLVAGALFALIAGWLKQPLLFGYVIAGIVLGPSVLGLVTDPFGTLGFFAEIALIFLLFGIGLELDFTKIKALGLSSVIVGSLQVLVVGAAAFWLALLFGFSSIESLYAGLIVAFSSTIVVVKLLSERRQLDAEHGRIVLGVLIVEDILAVIGLTLLGVLVDGEAVAHLVPTLTDLLAHAGVAVPDAGWAVLASLAVNGALFAASAYLLSRYVLPLVAERITLGVEMVFASSLALAFFLAFLAAFFGFSLAIGAFAAGIVLSSTVYRHEVAGKSKPVRDLFMVLFFVALGTLLTLENLGVHLPLILFLFLAAVLLKPALIFLLRKLFGYANHVSFRVSLAMAQISEFSLILALAGATQGSLDQGFVTAAVLATLLSMMLTAYLITYDEALYARAKRYLNPFEGLFGRRAASAHHAHEQVRPRIIVFGVSALSPRLARRLCAKGDALLIDKNPARLAPYRGLPSLCSDVYNLDLYDELIDFSRVELVISMMDDAVGNAFLLRKLSLLKKGALSALYAANPDDGRRLYAQGATFVLVPSVVGQRFLRDVLVAGDAERLRSLGRVYAQDLLRRPL